MKLGDYVEIQAAVDDPAAAQAFYEGLGFAPVDEDVVTDGTLNIRLRPAAGGVTLAYRGGDRAALAALDPGLAADGETAAFLAEGGLQVTVTAAAGPVPMPEGAPLAATPRSRLGKFGELALPVADAAAAGAFWGRFGFAPLFTAADPYPWGIYSDGLVVLGLHQTRDFAVPHLTYFAADMAGRLAALTAAGLDTRPVPPEVDGRVANAAFTGPGGLHFFLFVGEI